MRIVTWNVNSLNARSEFVSKFLDEVEPDVLCIQELKLPTDRVPRDLFESRGYSLAVHGQKAWNGVLVASRSAIESSEAGFDGEEDQSRLISVRTAGLQLVNLYCPQGQSADSPKFAYKLRFFAALNRWLRQRYDPADPLMVLGDINIAPTPDDVWDVAEWEGVPTYHPLEHEAWAELLAFGLTDVVKPRLPPRTFTFWDYRKARFRFNQGLRIDHVLVTAPLVDRVTAAVVHRPWRKKRGGLSASDHAPVSVEIP